MTKEEMHIEKLDLNSANIAEGKYDLFLRLFPEVRTEGGKIDFEKLKLALGEIIDHGKERYGMNWPGKTECFKTIQMPSTGTLLPDANDSVLFDNSENLIIEGDNLEVLKLLQKSYIGQIKLIYIDPPYNTGNDFIYPDNFTETLQTYLEYTGQIDGEGRKFSTNTETDGRFHSKWLNMMYPRLFLARNLLREDGVIFISIGDAEYDNLSKICKEIFGEENYLATLVWEKGRKNDAQRFSVGHEYLVGYAKNLSLIEEKIAPWREPKTGVAEIVEQYKKLKDEHGQDFEAISKGLVAFYKSLPEDHPSKKYSRSRFVDNRGIWRDNNISWPGGGGPRYDLLHPITKKPCKVPDDGWRFVEATMKQKVDDGYVQFREDHTQSPFLKSYLFIDGNTDENEDEDSGEKLQVMGSVFYRHSQPSNDVIKDLMGAKVFENPKDHGVLARLIRYLTNEEDTILDFFAGSGTTAHAVLELNKITGSNRKFILTQLPEEIKADDKNQALAIKFLQDLGKPLNIAEITKERVRRCIAKENISDGFRVFRLAESNFKTWNQGASSKEKLEEQLDLHVDHVKHDRTSADILYEILLKSGFPLSTKVEIQKFGKQMVYSIAGGMLLVCLEDNLTLDLIKFIAEQKPERVVCLDQGFANNDQLKANAVQIFRTKGIASFKTV